MSRRGVIYSSLYFNVLSDRQQRKEGNCHYTPIGFTRRCKSTSTSRRGLISPVPYGAVRSVTMEGATIRRQVSPLCWTKHLTAGVIPALPRATHCPRLNSSSSLCSPRHCLQGYSQFSHFHANFCAPLITNLSRLLLLSVHSSFSFCFRKITKQSLPDMATGNVYFARPK